MTNLIATDLQGMEVDSPLIDLFELVLPNDSILYFHPGVDDDANASSIQFKDVESPHTIRTYQPFPIDLDGLEIASDGAINRPNFTVANIGQFFSNLLSGYSNKDLIGQRITRRQTLQKYLVGETPGSPGAPVELGRVSYIIDRIAKETNTTITFEVSAVYDLDGIQIPRRVSVGKYCSWMYQGYHLYKKGGCTWSTGSTVYGFDREGGTIDQSKPLLQHAYFDMFDKPLISNEWATFSLNIASGVAGTTAGVLTLPSGQSTVFPPMRVQGTLLPDNTRVVTKNSSTSYQLNTTLLNNYNSGNVTFKNIWPWQDYNTYLDYEYARTGSGTTEDPYRYWQSLYRDNIDNDPTTSDGAPYWREARTWTDWNATTSYNEGDLVRHQIDVFQDSIGTIFRCTASHDTSNTTATEPSLQSSYWEREELCSKTLQGCKCRFQAIPVSQHDNDSPPSGAKKAETPLPFGSFLGLQKF